MSGVRCGGGDGATVTVTVFIFGNDDYSNPFTHIFGFIRNIRPIYKLKCMNELATGSCNFIFVVHRKHNFHIKWENTDGHTYTHTHT